MKFDNLNVFSLSLSLSLIQNTSLITNSLRNLKTFIKGLKKDQDSGVK